MNISLETTVLSNKDKILKIIKSKKNDTQFSYDVFRLIENKNSLRSMMSRFVKEGVIVKLHDGLFYRPKQVSFMKASVKEWSIDKKLFVHDHFWSVGDKRKVNIDQLIKAHLLSPNSDDIYTIYKLFGYKRVRTLLEEAYKGMSFNDDGVIRKHPNYKLSLSILTEIEKERFNDR